jgi:murein DD-endopeptidase MepM/ murein hydrolase activator NlpD
MTDAESPHGGRGVLLFVAGLVTGALAFYSIAWRTGALAPGHWLTRTSRDLSASSAPVRPLPTIPFPTPTAAARGEAAVPSPSTATPAVGALVAGALPVPDLGILRMPVQGVAPPSLKDDFEEARDGTRRHEAIDIPAPRGTPVIAVADGRVAKLFTSRAGGLTVYQFDGQGTYCFYYAHLDRYAPGLVEGAALRRGDRIGDVGTTGNAPKNTPHLHFAVFRLGPEQHWWQGEAINPYQMLLKAQDH